METEEFEESISLAIPSEIFFSNSRMLAILGTSFIGLAILTPTLLNGSNNF